MRTLRCTGVTRFFGGVGALDGVELEFTPGEVTAVVGPNGAGKTTLIDVLTGHTRPDSGRWFWGDIELTNRKAYQIARAGLARTFQQVRLVMQVSVLENILLAFPRQKGERLLSALFGIGLEEPENRHHRRSMELLEFIGFRGDISAPAAALSFGEQKLVAIACCLATEADVILLDEPVSGSDVAVKANILALLSQLRDKGKLIIFVEHDMGVVRAAADKVIVMNRGRVVCQGSPDRVFSAREVVEAYLG